MISIDKTSLMECLKESIKHYPLEVNIILVESGDCFFLKGISYLSKEEIKTKCRELDDVTPEIRYDNKEIPYISKDEYIGRNVPIKSTEENVKKLIKENEIIRGVLQLHTWQERAPEYSIHILTLLFRLYHKLIKLKMKKPELSNTDIRIFDEIIEPHAKKPVYYSVLNVPNPPKNVPNSQNIDVIMRELNERLLFFERVEDGKILTDYAIKE